MDFGITQRHTFHDIDVSTSISIVVKRRENEDVNVVEDKFLSNLDNLPEDILPHIEHFKQSYYFQKYQVKEEKDHSVAYQVAMHNYCRSKCLKAQKYLMLTLKEIEKKQKDDPCGAYQLLKHKIMTKITPNEKDLEDLKILIDKRHEKTLWLLDLIGLQQDGEFYKCTTLEEAHKAIMDEDSTIFKKSFKTPNYGFVEMHRGQLTIDMARKYLKQRKETRAYYLMKYSALCCYNLEAIDILMNQKNLKNEKKVCYKKLYEEAKTIGCIR